MLVLLDSALHPALFKVWVGGRSFRHLTVVACLEGSRGGGRLVRCGHREAPA